MARTPLSSKPDANFYGLIPQALATSMAQSGNPVDRVAMLIKARQAQQDYADASNRAMATEAAMSADENAADVAGRFIDQGANLTKAGVAQYFSLPDNRYLSVDGVGLAQAGSQFLDREAAAASKDRMDAAGTAAKNLGYIIPPEQMQGYMGSTLGPPPSGQITVQPTENAINQANANAAGINANARMLSAKKGHNVGDGSSETINYIIDPNGNMIPISGTTKKKNSAQGGNNQGTNLNRRPPKIDPNSGLVVPNG